MCTAASIDLCKSLPFVAKRELHFQLVLWRLFCNTNMNNNIFMKHERIHIGDKPFSWSQMYICSTSSHLKQQRTHTKLLHSAVNKRCDKSFKSAQYLRKDELICLVRRATYLGWFLQDLRLNPIEKMNFDVAYC